MILNRTLSALFRVISTKLFCHKFFGLMIIVEAKVYKLEFVRLVLFQISE